MSTSRTAWLSKPKDDDKISIGTFGYINARIRQRAYDLIIREFKKSGITQATLARRWGKGQDHVSRFLARPGNWELNTLAEALFAINGAVPSFGANHVEEEAQPDWLRGLKPLPPKPTSDTREMALGRAP